MSYTYHKNGLSESTSNPKIDNLLKVINTKKAGPEYKKALMDLIAMAEKKSGKTVNTKKEALLALDYVEPTIKENKTMKKSELTKMIQEVIKEVINEYSVYQGDVSQIKPNPTPKEGEMYLKDLKIGDKFSAGKSKYIVVKPDLGNSGVEVKYADGTGNMKFRGSAIVKVLSEQSTKKITEAYVPNNIKEFAKRKGASSLVNKVASWAEKCGKGIRGGTAIGKNYSTLVLDLGYQDGAIHINLDDQTVDLYGEEVFDVKSFKQALDNNASGMNEAVIDTEKAFRLVAKGDRDAALDALKKLISSDKEYSNARVTYILSKGKPKDIIIKLNGLGARVLSGMITIKNPVIKNNFDKVSTYKRQLTKIS